MKNLFMVIQKSKNNLSNDVTRQQLLHKVQRRERPVCIWLAIELVFVQEFMDLLQQIRSTGEINFHACLDPEV
jgi:hypothetical protein